MIEERMKERSVKKGIRGKKRERGFSSGTTNSLIIPDQRSHRFCSESNSSFPSIMWCCCFRTPGFSSLLYPCFLFKKKKKEREDERRVRHQNSHCDGWAWREEDLEIYGFRSRYSQKIFWILSEERIKRMKTKRLLDGRWGGSSWWWV